MSAFFVADAGRCDEQCSLILAALLAVLLCGRVPTVGAEAYYSQYRVRTPNMTLGLTQNQCINQCLSKPTCSAISFCNSPATVCFLQFCANVRLISAAGCNTIIFAAINFIDGVNIPAPTHEWLLTDSCSLSNYINTGVAYAPAMSVSSGVAALTYTPSYSMLFGQTLALAGNVSLANSQVQIDFSHPFSVFYWLKSTATVQSLSIVQLQYTDAVGFAYYFAVNYVSTYVQVVTNLGGCESCSASGNNFGISVGTWHSLVVNYAPKDSITVILDAAVVFSAPAWSEIAVSNEILPSIYSGGSNAISIYCYKIFNSTLNLSDAANVAQSCVSGKLTFLSSGCKPTNLVHNGVSYYFYNWTSSFYDAYVTCEANGQVLLKVDTYALMSFLSTNFLPHQPAAHVWTGLYSLTTGSYLSTWVTDGTILMYSDLPSYAYSRDYCCSIGPPWCWHLDYPQNTIGDNGCLDTVYGSPACTCT